MEKNEKIFRSKKDMLINNFLGGIAWGLGVTLGISILFALIGFIFSNINWIPFIGNFVSDVTNFVLQSNPNLIK